MILKEIFMFFNEMANISFTMIYQKRWTLVLQSKDFFIKVANILKNLRHFIVLG